MIVFDFAFMTTSQLPVDTWRIIVYENKETQILGWESFFAKEISLNSVVPYKRMNFTKIFLLFIK